MGKAQSVVMIAHTENTSEPTLKFKQLPKLLVHQDI